MTSLDSRHGDWIQTYTGKCFHPLDPRADDIDLVDIAHALSGMPRFNMHSSRHYSVAEHSILVACHVAQDDPDPRVVLAALLHDASEAYLCDVPRPLKMIPEMAAYRAMESAVEFVIAAKFGVPWPLPAIVKHHDERALATEYRDLVPVKSVPWNLRALPWEDMPAGCMSSPTRSLEPMFGEEWRLRIFDMSRVKCLFLAMVRHLTGDTTITVDEWHAETAARLLRNVSLPA
jgi:hypothetical protein